jgi:hypothetical protein
MKPMFALRGQRWNGVENPSGQPDGSYLKDYNHVTDSKASAKLFASEADAMEFYVDWLSRAPADLNYPVWLVCVEVKPVLSVVLWTSDKPIDLRK